jgi:cellulose synthase/poly-beta-1,6-N-acetylglucosamine synthase-like glycosyltransferase
MKLVFWSSIGLIFFAYVGYPTWLYFRARFWPRLVCKAPILPSVTIVLAVYNEGENIERKLRNLAELDYPNDGLDIIIVSDGSIDNTNKILVGCENSKLRTVLLQKHRGKATALNHGVAEAQGEIICFTDVRQTIASDGLKNLVANFADPSVGCISGQLMINEDPIAASADGVGLYWRLEKNIRYWEGLSGSTVGVTGAFYAVRRNLLLPLPEGTILDDVYIPLQVARQGKRVIFEPQAQAWDHLVPTARQEFRRKVRTLIGNYQLLQLSPWILTRSHPLRFQFVCHKLLRLLVPFALVAVLVSTLWLRSGMYEIALMLQLAFYALPTLGIFRAKFGFVSRLSNISLAFVVLNTAAAVALIYFITGRKEVWVR